MPGGFVSFGVPAEAADALRKPPTAPVHHTPEAKQNLEPGGDGGGTRRRRAEEWV